MNKDLIVFITSFDKIIAWIGTHHDIKIQGFTDIEKANNWLHVNEIGERYFNYGIFKECNLGIVNRILKAEGIL